MDLCLDSEYPGMGESVHGMFMTSILENGTDRGAQGNLSPDWENMVPRGRVQEGSVEALHAQLVRGEAHRSGANRDRDEQIVRSEEESRGDREMLCPRYTG